MLAQACLAVGRKIKKAPRARQPPHGKQTVRQLMGPGAAPHPQTGGESRRGGGSPGRFRRRGRGAIPQAQSGG